ncbi:MAG: glycosyltransferase family 4 protein [Nostochopsis sp.]
MRIIHILNEVQEIGNGIVNVAVDTACLQAKDGHEVAVISGGGGYENLLANYGVKHYLLDQTRKPKNLIKAAIGYKTIVKEFQPDIVHAHMMTGVILASFLRNKGKNRYGLVSSVHNEFQRSSIFMGLADRVIAVSKAVSEAMVRRGISKDKLRVVCNGTLGSPRNRPLQEYEALPLQHPAIATVAGMYYRKGIVELITAFEQIASDYPTANLYIIGNGPNRHEFEEQASKTVVSSRIHFEGFQPEPQRYLLACDIFVLASHREPFGLVLSEAREASCAIIATEVDGIPEALDNGQAGILVPAKDSNSLAAALVKLLSNPDTLHEWKTKAHQNLEWLNIDRVHQETLAVYDSLVSGRW